MYIYWSKNYGKNNMLGCHSICYLPGVYADLVWYHHHHIIFCPQLILNKINIIWWDHLNRQILISREKKISKMSSPSWRWTATAITGAINLPKWTLIEKWRRSINTINLLKTFGGMSTIRVVNMRSGNILKCIMIESDKYNAE